MSNESSTELDLDGVFNELRYATSGSQIEYNGTVATVTEHQLLPLVRPLSGGYQIKLDTGIELIVKKHAEYGITSLYGRRHDVDWNHPDALTKTEIHDIRFPDSDVDSEQSSSESRPDSTDDDSTDSSPDPSSDGVQQQTWNSFQ